MNAAATDNIPSALATMNRFVVWKLATKPGRAKPTKIPYQAADPSREASSTDPKTWASFEQAVAAIERMPGQLDGIGFVLGDGISGVDLDNCIDAATGELEPAAAAIIAELETYAEVSPSGRGVKLFGKGSIPSDRGRRFDHQWGSGGGSIELYSHGRFFTVTGNHWPESPSEIRDFDRPLKELFLRLEAQKSSRRPVVHRPARTDSADVPMQVRTVRCREYLKHTPDAISGQGGHDRTLHAACECIRFGLDEAATWDVLRWFNDNKTGGEPWTEKELAHKITSAEKEAGHDRGSRLRETPVPRRRTPAAAPAANATSDNPGDNIIEYPEPIPLAENFARTMADADGQSMLRRYAGQWYGHSEGCYRIIDTEALLAAIYQHVDTCWTPRRDPSTGEPTGKLKHITANRRIASEVDAALISLPGMLVNGQTPQWLDGTPYDPRELLITRNGIYDLATVRLLSPPTPLLFSTSCLEFDFDPSAPDPIHWLQFLDSLWPDDPQSIELVQDWFGYCLTPDTRQQKAFMLVGPKRSGKGTIARTLTKLVGSSNVCAPTLGGLATNFGLWPMIGKQLAIIGDARLSGRTDQAAIVERILSITGEDRITIDRKCMKPIEERLPTRLMMLSNELPKLSDASGALPGRFLFGILRNSFYGHEDHDLEPRLYGELPGILLWAIEGWKRLRKRGYFVQAATSEAAVTEMNDLSSPVSAFVRDWCRVGQDASILARELFAGWEAWCAEQGRHAGNAAVFGRDLRAAFSSIETSNRRDGETRHRHYEGIALTLKAEAASASWRSKAGQAEGGQ